MLLTIMEYGRITAFYLCLFSIATAVIWNFFPEWVDVIDKNVLSAYKRPQRKAVKQAEKLIAQNLHEQAKPILTEVLVDLGDTKKGDRLSSYKRRAFKALTNLHIDGGDFTSALAVGEQWRIFDEKDLNAQVLVGKAMYQLKDKRDAGTELLKGLYKIVPEVEFVALAYAEQLVNRGQYLDSFRVLSKLISGKKATFSDGWRYFWDLGDGFKGAQSKPVVPEVSTNGLLTFKFELQKGVVRLRVDPPPLSRYLLNSPYLRWGKGAHEINLSKSSLGLHHMTQLGIRLSTNGGADPYFHWAMPPSLEEGGDDLLFTTKVAEGLPEWIVKFVSTGLNSVRLRDAIHSSGDDQLSASYDSMLERITLQHPQSQDTKRELRFGVYWSDSQKHFSEERTVKVDVQPRITKNEGEFKVFVEVNEILQKLRIDLPSTPGLVYIIDSVEIITDSGSQLLNINELNWILKNDIEVLEGRLEVVSGDPHFAIKIGRSLVKSMLMRGTVY